MSPELAVSFFFFFHSVMDFILSILVLCILGGNPKAMWQNIGHFILSCSYTYLFSSVFDVLGYLLTTSVAWNR